MEEKGTTARKAQTKRKSKSKRGQRGRPRGSIHVGNTEKPWCDDGDVKIVEDDQKENFVQFDENCDITELEAPTFTTLDRGPPATMLQLSWDHPVNLIGEKVLSPRIHICDICDKPILLYGRMIPCKHVFCLSCAKSEDRVCHRCGERVARVEQTGLGTVFLCSYSIGDALCKRTYLSQRDLQAHVDHRHAKSSTISAKEEIKEPQPIISARDPRAESRPHENRLPLQKSTPNDARINKENLEIDLNQQRQPTISSIGPQMHANTVAPSNTLIMQDSTQKLHFEPSFSQPPTHIPPTGSPQFQMLHTFRPCGPSQRVPQPNIRPQTNGPPPDDLYQGLPPAGMRLCAPSLRSPHQGISPRNLNSQGPLNHHEPPLMIPTSHGPPTSLNPNMVLGSRPQIATGPHPHSIPGQRPQMPSEHPPGLRPHHGPLPTHGRTPNPFSSHPPMQQQFPPQAPSNFQFPPNQQRQQIRNFHMENRNPGGNAMPPQRFPPGHRPAPPGPVPPPFSNQFAPAPRHNWGGPPGQHQGNFGQRAGFIGQHSGNPGQHPGNHGQHSSNPGQHPGNPGQHPSNHGQHPSNHGQHPSNPGQHPGNHGQHPSNPGQHLGNPGQRPSNSGQHPGNRGPPRPQRPVNFGLPPRQHLPQNQRPFF